MSFADLVKSRYSVRSFKDTPVPEDVLNAVLEAGRLAPSATNSQPVHFIVIRSEVNRKKLKSVYDRDWFVCAPVIIALCLDQKEAWVRRDKKSYGDVDVGICGDHMTLAATEAGLGSCWVGAFDLEKAKEALGTPDNLLPMIFLPLGYPACQPPAVRKRKELGEIVSWEIYGHGK